MTEREITGDAVRSKYKRAQKVASELGLSDEVLTALAEGVREFDASRSDGYRQTQALEKIAVALSPAQSGKGESWAFEERRLRRREVAAQELASLALLADDEDVVKIKAGKLYQRLFERATSTVGPGDGS